MIACEKNVCKLRVEKNGQPKSLYLYIYNLILDSFEVYMALAVRLKKRKGSAAHVTKMV